MINKSDGRVSLVLGPADMNGATASSTPAVMGHENTVARHAKRPPGEVEIVAYLVKPDVRRIPLRLVRVIDCDCDAEYGRHKGA